MSVPHRNSLSAVRQSVFEYYCNIDLGDNIFVFLMEYSSLNGKTETFFSDQIYKLHSLIILVLDYSFFLRGRGEKVKVKGGRGRIVWLVWGNGLRIR